MNEDHPLFRWKLKELPGGQIGMLGIRGTVLGPFLLDSALPSVGGTTYGVIAANVALGAVPVAAGIALPGRGTVRVLSPFGRPNTERLPTGTPAARRTSNHGDSGRRTTD